MWLPLEDEDGPLYPDIETYLSSLSRLGLPEECITHGLRKCAARTLADAGCTTEEIKSIIGHKTDRVVAHYVKTANKKRRARSAMAKWENNK